MATGERGFAETYLRTDRIDRRAPLPSPALETPANDAELAGAVKFDWTRTMAASGEPITYRHCVWNGDQSYDFNNCGVVAAGRPPAVLYAGVVGLLALLLFIVLLFLAFEHKRVVLALAAIVILASILAALGASRSAAALTTTVAQLQPGKVYFWRVIAEDREGAMVESPVRRFLVR